VEKVANETEAFDPPHIKPGKRDEALGLIEDLAAKLGRMQEPLIIEARRHLEFDAGGFFRGKCLSAHPGSHLDGVAVAWSSAPTVPLSRFTCASSGASSICNCTGTMTQV
jgi:hypothetical protein